MVPGLVISRVDSIPPDIDGLLLASRLDLVATPEADDATHDLRF